MLALSSSCKTFIVIVTILPCVLMTPACMSCRRSQQASNEELDSGRSYKEQNTPQDAKGRGRNRCCPYDFDPKFCRYVDDRFLCGYNKNLGRIQSKDEIERLSDGCRIRDGRIECGYEHPPFNNPRRPPVWGDSVNVGDTKHGKTEDLKLVQKLSGRSVDPDSTTNSGRVTRCMETADNRIVCREV